MKRRLVALAFVAILGVAAVGCGGGSTTSEVSGSTLSKAEFAKEVNAICQRRQNEALGKVSQYVEENVVKGQSPAKAANEEGELQVEAIDIIFLPPLEKEMKEVETLGAPPSQQAEVERFVNAYRAAIALIRSREYTPTTVATKFGTEFRQSSELAKELGLTSCMLA